MEVPTVARSNPVQNHFLVQGRTLVAASIRTIKGQTMILRHKAKSIEPVSDPASAVWLTRRMVDTALAKLSPSDLLAAIGGNVNALDLNVVSITPALNAALQSTRTKRRVTAEHIVHMLGGDSPENRAFAIKQVELLEDYYLGAPAVTAAA